MCVCVNVDTGKAKVHSIVGHLFFVSAGVLAVWVGMKLFLLSVTTADQSVICSPL